jgi:spore coat polysaccharide biosynthesis protein SpsF
MQRAEAMKTMAITQARVGSTRFPNKLLRKLEDGTSLLELHLSRAKRASRLDQLCVATTFEDGVGQILAVADEMGITVFQGSEDDVLDRFYQAAISTGELPEYVVRLTADCPLIDPVLIDLCVEKMCELKVDYLSNVLEPKYPDGQDVEIFTFKALEQAWRNATAEIEREHVTPYIWLNSDYKGRTEFKSYSFVGDADYNRLRMTIDYEEDFLMLNHLLKTKGMKCGWLEYAEELLHNGDLRRINEDFERNEGRLPSKY